MTKSYIETLTDFLENYQNNILSKLGQEEVIRKEKLKELIKHRLKIIGYFILLIIIVQIFTEITSPNDINMLIFNQGIISGVIILNCITLTNLFRYDIEKEFQKYLKHKYLPKMLKCWKNIVYKKDIICTNQILKECSNLFDKYREYDVDDRFSGEYNDVHFEILDRVYLNEYTFKFLKDFNSPKKKAFDGCIICFQLNKKTTSKTTISSNDSLNKEMFVVIFMDILLPILTIADMIYNGISSLTIAPFIFVLIVLTILSTIFFKKYFAQKKSKLHLEDFKFNKTFVTYSSDQVEGRYNISPAFMERLLKLKLAFKATSLDGYFYDDKFIIALKTTKDLFEIGDLWHPLTDTKYTHDFYSEMYSILNIIDILKLNENTKL